MKRNLIAAAVLSATAFCAPAQADLLYTFSYDGLGVYAADSITFSSATFADSVGDVLTYVSGDINGCAPATLAVDGSNAFATPVFGTGSCGDGVGPDVDGLFFRPDTMPPLSLGVFISTKTAGRQFESGGGGSFYQYVGGSLTIRGTAIPEPGTLALAGLALAALASSRRRRSK